MLVDKTLLCANGCGFLISTQYAGVKVNVCPQCRGIWLTHKNLNTLINHKETILWSIDYNVDNFQQAYSSKIPQKKLKQTPSCPECKKLMMSVNYQYSSGIIIYQCQYNHGVWLNNDDLSKIWIYKESLKKKFNT